MAKVLPAGANVNLNLGEDPFDRLLKTIQTASQVQGVVNQAQLQRDRRNAIKTESLQTMMINAVSGMDAENPSSIAETKNSLVEMKDKFIAENPGLSDDIETFYGTTYNTTIKPIEDVHSKFNLDKERLYSSIQKLNDNILALPDETIVPQDKIMFKQELMGLHKALSSLKSNAALYNKTMPGLSGALLLDADNAERLSRKLPELMVGLFDDFEQDLTSQLLNNQLSFSLYEQEMNKYYAKNDGKAASIIVPRLENELQSLYTSYQSESVIYDSILSGSIETYDDAESSTSQKNYFDSDTGVYYYNNQPLNKSIQDDQENYNEDKEEWLKNAQEQAASQMKKLVLDPLEDSITDKDKLRGSYNLKIKSDDSSYATLISDSQKWPWEDDFFIEDTDEIDVNTDNNKNNIPDYLERSEGDKVQTGQVQTGQVETGQVEAGGIGQTYSSITDFVVDYGREYGDETAGVIGASALAYNIPKVNSAIKSATNYVSKVLDLPSDSVIDLYNDSDFKAVSKQLSSIDKKIATLQSQLPEGVKLQDLRETVTKDTTVPIIRGGKQTSTITMKQTVKDDFYRKYKNLLIQKKKIIENSKQVKNLITKMEAGHFPDLKFDKNNLPAFRQKIMNFLKDSDKWDLNAVKRTVTKSAKQAYRTPKDLYNVLTTGAVRLSPYDAAIHAWFMMPEDASIGYKIGASSATVLTGKKILNYAKTKGISPFLNDKKLTSELGKFLMKKAPGTMAKMGFKTVGGAAAAGTVIGSAISAGMLAWTLNDIRKLMKEFPEIRQMFSDSIARQESGELDSPNQDESMPNEVEQAPVIDQTNWMKPYSQQGE